MTADALRNRRCENCASWGWSDGVWGICLRAESDDARMAVREDPRGVCGTLETRHNFGCVEWRTANLKPEPPPPTPESEAP